VYSYSNSSRNLCIKCWDSAFSAEFQHFILRFPYFADTTKRDVKGVKDKVKKTGWLYGFLYCNAWNQKQKIHTCVMSCDVLREKIIFQRFYKKNYVKIWRNL
jgi:hypothetical protein